MIVLGRKTHGTESGGCEPGVISSTGQGQESLDKIRLLDCANDQNLNDYLDYLEGALRGRIRIEKHESKIRMWNIRFSLSCLRMVKEQAAEQLRDKVAASLDSFQVPFSGFWLHTVTKISYATICDYIGLSNVAELKSVTDTEVLMSVDIPMSWISRQWFDPRDRNLPEPAVSNSDEGVGQNNSVGETLAMETDVDFTADFDHILCEPGIFDPRFAFPT
uniref:Uncharacterized protein n=1 Tax=Fusarium oxysporum (strain Fo5176) TaxID=660025 RepID=A0A0D2XBY2_FUSOF